MKKFLEKLPIILIFLIPALVAWPLLLPGYFSHHDDLQVMRIFEMRKCILDLQIPCRWVPDMGYGNGYPLFNYYAVFPYYIGAIFSFILGYINAAKLLFAIPLFLGSISMYLLSKEFFGKWAGLLSSALFTLAPYHALDLYVRGDVAESFAMSLIPFCFFFSYKIIKENKKSDALGLSLSLAFFLTSHNIMTVLFMPVLFIFCIFWLFIQKSKNVFLLLISFILGIGMSAFFVIPAYFEKNLVQIDNLIRLDLNFRAHFTTINQLLFDRTWGYGSSVPGAGDTISFQLGWPHWWLAILALLFFFNFKSKKSFRFFGVLMFLIFGFSSFMTHIVSAFIWERVEILKFTQFPWRFLSVSVFASALLGGVIVFSFKENYKKYCAIFLIVLTTLLNWNYFKPDKFFTTLNDSQKLSGELWDEQRRAAVSDYVPDGALVPTEPAPTKPVVLNGKAKIDDYKLRSNSWKFNASVLEDSKIEIPVFEFENWKVTGNGQVLTKEVGRIGRIKINLPPGEYKVEGHFENTLIRTVTNLISLFSFIFSIFLFKIWKNKNELI